MMVSVIDIGDMGADAVEEMAVVRDGDDDAVVGVEKSLEPVDGIEVEVVGWFIQQQRLRVTEQSLRQQYPDFLSALEFGHFSAVEFFGNIEASRRMAASLSAV